MATRLANRTLSEPVAENPTREPGPADPDLAGVAAAARATADRTKHWWAVVAGAWVSMTIVFAAVYVLRPKTGTLVVRVAASVGALVEQLEVRVDGELKCRLYPCTVEKLRWGKHRVDIIAPGFRATPTRWVVVEPGTDAVVDYWLVPR
jgi:hypothetical protein